MRVQIYPADEGACAHFRCLWPAHAAESECGVEWQSALEVSAQHLVGSGVRRVRPVPMDVDVVVWGRPTPRRETIELMEGYAAQGIANVVDIDDDLSCPHPSHPGNRILSGGEFNARWLARACSIADLVTVSTPALAERYGSHGRVAILRNRVPRTLLELPKSDDGRTCGWAGLVLTHPGDLSVTHGGVATAVRDARWRFHVVGPGTDVKRELGLDEGPSSTGRLGLDEWHRALGDLTVGIVPLGNTKFNAAKSALKGLEYAARGVPFVASPTPEYRLLAEEGAGLVAPSRGRNWRAQLLKLMRDDTVRAEAVEEGRSLIRQKHMYEGNGWRWAESWQAALDHRRARASVR